jgi:uncharacterized cupin superfamily protein
MIVSGSMTLRTPEGLEEVTAGDIVFFEMGETGAHQFHNHGTDPCIYLDVRSFIGYDVCEYPDSEKILLAPSFEIFKIEDKTAYFEGETNISEKWKTIKPKSK